MQDLIEIKNSNYFYSTTIINAKTQNIKSFIALCFIKVFPP